MTVATRDLADVINAALGLWCEMSVELPRGVNFERPAEAVAAV